MMLYRWLFERNRGTEDSAKKQQPSNAIASFERTYLNDKPYVLPKDAREEERMAFQHRLLKAIFGLYTVPLPASPIILDVGSGAGMWSRDIAHKLSDAQVYAIDLEEPKITGHLKPPNYHYHKVDLLKQFPFPVNTFHLVYERLLAGAIPTTMWSHLFNEELRVLQYGGWLEMIEVADICVDAGPLMQQFMQWLRYVCAKNGIYLSAVKDVHTTLETIGFQNITYEEINLPLGEWGGVNGKNFALDMVHILFALKDPIVKYCNVPSEKFDARLRVLPEEWEKYRTSYIWYHVKAQKIVL